MTDRKIEDEEEDDIFIDSEEDNNEDNDGCGYNGGYGNISNKYNDFLNDKFSKW